MAKHDDDDEHSHRGHAPAHGYPDDPAAEERLNREILADREWVFDTFVRLTAWTLVLIFVILAFLALTQT